MIRLTRKFLNVFSRTITYSYYHTTVHGHVINASNVALTCTVGHIISKVIQQFYN